MATSTMAQVEEKIGGIIARYRKAASEATREALAKELAQVQAEHAWVGRGSDSPTRSAWRAALKRLWHQHEALTAKSTGPVSGIMRREKLLELERHIDGYELRIRSSEAEEDGE